MGCAVCSSNHRASCTSWLPCLNSQVSCRTEIPFLPEYSYMPDGRIRRNISYKQWHRRACVSLDLPFLLVVRTGHSSCADLAVCILSVGCLVSVKVDVKSYHVKRNHKRIPKILVRGAYRIDAHGYTKHPVPHSCALRLNRVHSKGSGTC
eukprot:6210703-Pleurochrysis_carterae.AAC.1